MLQGHGYAVNDARTVELLTCRKSVLRHGHTERASPALIGTK